jgi:hypothetical protein
MYLIAPHLAVSPSNGEKTIYFCCFLFALQALSPRILNPININRVRRPPGHKIAASSPIVWAKLCVLCVVDFKGQSLQVAPPLLTLMTPLLPASPYQYATVLIQTAHPTFAQCPLQGQAQPRPPGFHPLILPTRTQPSLPICPRGAPPPLWRRRGV